MLVLVVGQGPDECTQFSRWLQFFDFEAGGWGRLEDMDVERPLGCSVAAVGTCLFTFGGQEEMPGCMTMYDMATRTGKEAGLLWPCDS